MKIQEAAMSCLGLILEDIRAKVLGCIHDVIWQQQGLRSGSVFFQRNIRKHLE